MAVSCLFHAGCPRLIRYRKVLDNVHLSFYPDAKIGCSRQRLRQIDVAANHGRLDKEYNGEAWVAEGARSATSNRTAARPAKTVRENVMLGVAKQKRSSTATMSSRSLFRETADE